MPVSGFLLMYEHPAMTASGFLKSKTPDVGVVESYTRKSIYSIIHLLWILSEVCLVVFSTVESVEHIENGT